jgi:hypothetical protein
MAFDWNDYYRRQGTLAPETTATGINPALTTIIDQVNEINRNSQQAANAGRIPGGAGLEEQSSGNISRALSGEIDPSVLQQLGQRSAERGIMTGSPNGPGTNAEYLRAIGLTSQDLMNQGQNWLTQADARNPGAPVYDAGNQVLTAAQGLTYSLEQQRLNQQRQQANQALRAEQSRAWNASKPQSASATAGGGSGLYTGGGYTNGMYTGGGGGAPGINWNDLFGGNSGAPFVGDDMTDLTGADFNWGSPSGGNATAGIGNWMDDMLWDNASDVNPGPTAGNDYNYQDWEAYA